MAQLAVTLLDTEVGASDAASDRALRWHIATSSKRRFLLRIASKFQPAHTQIEIKHTYFLLFLKVDQSAVLVA